jgi:hypothetical protein
MKIILLCLADHLNSELENGDIVPVLPGEEYLAETTDALRLDLCPGRMVVDYLRDFYRLEVMERIRFATSFEIFSRRNASIVYVEDPSVESLLKIHKILRNVLDDWKDLLALFDDMKSFFRVCRTTC